MMKSRILVVDDESAIRSVFNHFLSREGHEVVTVEDYESAIELLSDSEFDIMFVDIVLEEHTGLEILQKVNDRGLFCPVVMVTGVPTIDSAADAVRMGAFDYLSKPVRLDDLRRVTANALQHKKLY